MSYVMLGPIRHLLGQLRRERLRRSQPAAVRVWIGGVELREGGEVVARFAWEEVQEVVTFKRDMGTVDDIRLAFRVGEEWTEFSEEIPGWSELCDALTENLPEVPSDWHQKVMFPAFETNYRVLYRRD